jgi:hypothetical protein
MDESTEGAWSRVGEEATQGQTFAIVAGNARGSHRVGALPALVVAGRPAFVTVCDRAEVGEGAAGLHDDPVRWWQDPEPTPAFVGTLAAAVSAVDQGAAGPCDDRECVAAPATLSHRFRRLAGCCRFCWCGGRVRCVDREQ